MPRLELPLIKEENPDDNQNEFFKSLRNNSNDDDNIDDYLG